MIYMIVESMKGFYRFRGERTLYSEAHEIIPIMYFESIDKDKAHHTCNMLNRAAKGNLETLDDLQTKIDYNFSEIREDIAFGLDRAGVPIFFKIEEVHSYLEKTK